MRSGPDPLVFRAPQHEYLGVNPTSRQRQRSRALGSSVLSSACLLTSEATTLCLRAFALAAGMAGNTPPSHCCI